MAKTNTTKKAEEVVVPTVVVADNATTTTEDTKVTTEIKAPSKAEKAQAIFVEEAAKGEEKLRARVMARFVAELGMSTAGGSTYFQNCKTKAAGEKVKHYYKPASERKAPAVETVDDSKEDAAVFESELVDGTIKCFLSQADKEEFDAANAELLKPSAE